MKIRNGFVSNSSSSSFCIYGTSFDDMDEVKKLLKLDVKEEDDNEEGYTQELKDALEGMKNLEYIVDHNNGYIYIGRSWSSIGNKETGEQFKQDVEQSLKTIFGKKMVCDTQEEVIVD